MLPLGSIFRKHGVAFHFYADDTQIYLPFRKNDPLAMTALSSCLDKVNSWLSQNVLSLNEEKTEVIVFGPSENMKAFNYDLGSLSAFRSSQVQNLGILLDDTSLLFSLTRLWRWRFMLLLHHVSIIVTRYTVAFPKLKLPVFNWSKTLPLDFFKKIKKGITPLRF